MLYVYCSLTLESELLRHILELTVRRGDLKFLKYLIRNQNVDIDGKHTNGSLPHPKHVHMHNHMYTYQLQMIAFCLSLTTAPLTKSLLTLSVREGKVAIIRYLVTECDVRVNGE